MYFYSKKCSVIFSNFKRGYFQCLLSENSNKVQIIKAHVSRGIYNVCIYYLGA